MEIKLFVTDGHVAFQCEGLLLRPLEKIILKQDIGVFSLLFDNKTEIEMDCPVCPETMDAIGDHGFCGMGFYFNGEMLGASVYPLEKQ